MCSHTFHRPQALTGTLCCPQGNCCPGLPVAQQQLDLPLRATECQRARQEIFTEETAPGERVLGHPHPLSLPVTHDSQSGPSATFPLEIPKLPVEREAGPASSPLTPSLPAPPPLSLGARGNAARESQSLCPVPSPAPVSQGQASLSLSQAGSLLTRHSFGLPEVVWRDCPGQGLPQGTVPGEGLQEGWELEFRSRGSFVRGLRVGGLTVSVVQLCIRAGRWRDRTGELGGLQSPTPTTLCQAQHCLPQTQGSQGKGCRLVTSLPGTQPLAWFGAELCPPRFTRSPNSKYLGMGLLLETGSLQRSLT